MRYSLSELEMHAATLSRRAFPMADPESIVLKATEEVGELARCVNLKSDAHYFADRKVETCKEATDVIVSILCLMGRYHPEFDLAQGISDKLDILDKKFPNRASAENYRKACQVAGRALTMEETVGDFIDDDI
jgi:NTP pyrophosphatase (non-canonical NTP hydrolase)